MTPIRRSSRHLWSRRYLGGIAGGHDLVLRAVAVILRGKTSRIGDSLEATLVPVISAAPLYEIVLVRIRRGVRLGPTRGARVGGRGGRGDAGGRVRVRGI